MVPSHARYSGQPSRRAGERRPKINHRRTCDQRRSIGGVDYAPLCEGKVVEGQKDGFNELLVKN